MKITKDDMYEKVEPPFPLHNCACCGSPAELWKYRKNPDSLVYIAGCSKVEGFGEMGRLSCPMYELDHLQCSTKKQAATYWNSLVLELRNSREQEG